MRGLSHEAHMERMNALLSDGAEHALKDVLSSFHSSYSKIVGSTVQRPEMLLATIIAVQ
jgi:hypothetical protein